MGLLIKLATLLEKAIYPAVYRINQFGVSMLVVMVLLVAVDVVSRRIFNSPLPSSLELIEILLVIVVFFSVAYTGTQKGHISMDILVSRFPPKTQGIINAVNYILALGLFIFISWKTVIQALNVWKLGRATAILEIPLYPFVLIVAFGSALLALVIFIQLLNYIISARMGGRK